MYGEQSYVEVLCGGVLGYCRTTAAGWPHSLLALGWHLVECGAVVGQGWETAVKNRVGTGNVIFVFPQIAVQTKMNKQSAMRSASRPGQLYAQCRRLVLPAVHCSTLQIRVAICG
jgi:hypothetical protein